MENVHFPFPGSISSVPGTTQSLVLAASSPITGIVDIVNYGTTFNFGAATFNLLATTQYDALNITGHTLNSVYSFLFPNNPTPFDFVKSQNTLAANQWDFFSYPSATFIIGVTSYDYTIGTSTFGFTYSVTFSILDYDNGRQYSLPKPWVPPGAFFNGVVGVSAGFGFSGFMTINYSFVRSDGFFGPSAGYTLFSATGLTVMFLQQPIVQPNAGPGTSLSLNDFNIDKLAFWLTQNDLYFSGTGYLAPANQVTLRIFYNTTPFVADGYEPTANEPEEFLGTFLYGFETEQGSLGPPTSGANNPACIELFNNQLFAGGFLHTPDDVWYSEIGELEKHDPEGSFQVFYADGDIVSCLKAYLTRLIIFKVNSIAELSGDDPDNFAVAEVTKAYGCLSNKAAVIYEDILWFLDKAGIAQYNGAQTAIVSNNMEPIFRRMNCAAARTQAHMIHAKDRKEVWCAIPIDGSERNNIVIVYDYFSKQWSTQKLTVPTAALTTSVGASNQVTYYGDASGMVFEFGQSFTTFNGQAFTSVIKTRYLGDLGNSVEKQFRRLYIDMDVPEGLTYPMTVNFYTDQSNVPAKTMTFALTQFQTRADFGLPAKDMAVEFIYSGGQYLKLNGYTIEYRFQRAV